MLTIFDDAFFPHVSKISWFDPRDRKSCLAGGSPHRTMGKRTNDVKIAIWHLSVGKIFGKYGNLMVKKNMNLGCIYSVYIRIPYTAWLIITCPWRMHQEHAGPCHVA